MGCHTGYLTTGCVHSLVSIFLFFLDNVAIVKCNLFYFSPLLDLWTLAEERKSSESILALT